MICNERTLARFRRNPKRLIGQWILWSKVNPDIRELDHLSVRQAYIEDLIYEVVWVEGSQVLLYLVVPCPDGSCNHKVEIPLSTLLRKGDPFFHTMEHLGPREIYEWIFDLGIIRLKLPPPNDFYAEITCALPRVQVNYIPRVLSSLEASVLHVTNPELREEEVHRRQEALPRYPFVYDPYRGVISFSYAEFLNFWEEVKDPNASEIWREDHARRLRERNPPPLEVEPPQPPPPPEVDSPRPSIWKRIRDPKIGVNADAEEE